MTAPLPAVFVQGLGSATADNLNTYCQTVVNVAQARSFPALSNMLLFVQGTTTPNDGGQGMFWWNSTSTAADDSGVTTIVPPGATGSGAWNRITLSSILTNSVPLTALAQIGANTILGNNTSGTGNVTALTESQIVAMLVGTSANTLAAGNDSRFLYVGQNTTGTNYALSATDQGKELKVTASGVTITLTASVFSPSGTVRITGLGPTGTVTLAPGSGASLTWLPSGTTGNRTLTFPFDVLVTADTATSYRVGAGGIS